MQLMLVKLLSSVPEGGTNGQSNNEVISIQ
jgi:hypothetical protein